MYQWKFELVLYSSSLEEISNKLFDGSQSNSYDRRIFWHSRSSSSVGRCVMSSQVDPYIFIGINRSSDASIPKWKYKDQLVSSSRILLLMTNSLNVKRFSYHMNLIGIHQIICLGFPQRRRSIGQVQMFIDTSILLRPESHAHLQRSSVEMTW